MDFSQRMLVSNVFQQRAAWSGNDAEKILVCYGDDCVADRTLHDIAGDVLDDRNMVGASVCRTIESLPSLPGENFEAKVVRLVMLREPGNIPA